jgi:hypothetical protein
MSEIRVRYPWQSHPAHPVCCGACATGTRMTRANVSTLTSPPFTQLRVPLTSSYEVDCHSIHNVNWTTIHSLTLTWVPDTSSHEYEYQPLSHMNMSTSRFSHEYEYQPLSYMNMSTSRSLTWIWVPAAFSHQYEYQPLSHINMSTSRSLTSIWVPAALSHQYEYQPLSHMNMRNSLFLTRKWILVTFLHDIFSGKYEYTSLLSHSGVPVHTLTWTRAPDLSHDWKNERKKRSESICALRRNSVDLPWGEQCYCTQFRAQQNEM